MRTRGCSLLVIVMWTLVVSQASARAHHSVAAEFDGRRWVTLTGTITKVEWTNPHTFFYVDAKDSKTGQMLNWACELGSPNMLLARGWKPNTLKVGMNVNVSGILARDGSPKVNARNIIVDGIRLSAWPSDDTNR